MEAQFRQPKQVVNVEVNKQSIARNFGIKDSEVCYAKPGQTLTGYKAIFDKTNQRAYMLPTGLTGTVVLMAQSGVLTHSDGSVDLGDLAVVREEYVTLPGSFAEGGTLNTRNEVLLSGDLKYRWAGALPKIVTAGDTPESTGGVNVTAWILVGVYGLRESLSGDSGAGAIGYKLKALATAVSRTVANKLDEVISVRDFGAKGDGVTDDADAIQAAILYAESLPQVLTHPYSPVTVWFPAGSYRHTKPVRVTQPILLSGSGVEIKALAPYTSLTVPLQAGGTEEFRGQLYVVHGNKGADSSLGQLRWGFGISKGILLSANDTAMSNIYMERFVNARINSALQDSPTDGLVVGPSCWGLSTHALSIENFNRYAIHFLANSAVNGAVLDVRIWGNFKVGAAGILFDVGSACNGVTITGYIEKIDYGIIAARSTGAVLVSGVDFEQCTNRVLQASSDGSDGLTIGRITFKNCYLHSIGASKIYAQNTVVSVEGCTMNASTTDFETDAAGTGYIYADNNDYLIGYAGIVPGFNVDVKFNDALVRDFRVYQPVKSTSFADVPLINLYQYKDSPNTLSSRFNFQSRWNGTDSKYEQESTWAVTDYYPSTGLKRECGVTISTVGSFSLRPLTDNLINAGLPTYRFTAVYAVNGTLQTSDERHKNIRSIAERELAVGTALAPLMVAFTWKAGDDKRTHFGCSAQKVMQIFNDNGLNAEDYSIVEYSEEADIYSVNYSELATLCIAALASKLV